MATAAAARRRWCLMIAGSTTTTPVLLLLLLLLLLLNCGTASHAFHFMPTTPTPQQLRQSPRTTAIPAWGRSSRQQQQQQQQQAPPPRLVKRATTSLKLSLLDVTTTTPFDMDVVVSTPASSALSFLTPNIPSSITSILLSLEATASTADAATTTAMVSPEPIHTAFTVATFFPQPFFVLLILFPNWSFTKQLLRGFQIPALVACIHLFIVIQSILLENASAPLAEFNQVFDPSGNPQLAFQHMVQSYPNFVAEEWSHVLTWDFIVAWWIWQDGLRRDIFTSHSILFCNLIGPPGLILHWITCLVSGKTILDSNQQIQVEE